MSTRPVVTLLLYIIVNFIVAALWHLVLFEDALAAATPFAREEPIFALGIAAMVVQGSLLIAIYPRFHKTGSRLRSGLLFGAGAGLFLATGAVWVDVGKFDFSGPTSYLLLESIYEVLSFSLLGLVIAFRHKEPAASAS